MRNCCFERELKFQGWRSQRWLLVQNLWFFPSWHTFFVNCFPSWVDSVTASYINTTSQSAQGTMERAEPRSYTQLDLILAPCHLLDVQPKANQFHHFWAFSVVKWDSKNTVLTESLGLWKRVQKCLAFCAVIKHWGPWVRPSRVQFLFYTLPIIKWMTLNKKPNFPRPNFPLL